MSYGQSNNSKLTIFIAPLRGEFSSPQKPSAIIGADLDRSSQFNVLTSDVIFDETERPDFSLASQKGANAILTGSVTRLADGRFDLRIRLWDVLGYKDLGAMSYVVNSADIRLASHQSADFIYQRLTGNRGSFATRIAYVTKTAGERFNLLVADSDGENSQSALKSPRMIISPSWSPSGQQLAYVSYETEKPTIYVHDVASGKRRLLVEGLDPTWSQDGKYILFSSLKDGLSQIYLKPVQGGEPKKINTGLDNNSEPVFSFDSNYIYFVKEKNGQSNIYRLSIPNAKIQMVTAGSGVKNSPVVSLNGKYLAYIVKRDSGSSIEVINVETSSLVSSKKINNQDKVSFSPDSEYLIYKNAFNGKDTLVTSRVDGDSVYPLSLVAGEVSQPSWSPWYLNVSSAEKKTDSNNIEKLYASTQEFPEKIADSLIQESLNNQKILENQRLKIQTEEANRKQAELEAQTKLTQQQQQSSPSNISPRNSKRIALVIGNANYNSAPLKNPLNDAADISAALRQSGFEVIDQRNATLQEMTRGIREFGDKLLKSDVGLVYYSGHGLEVKGRNYLLPVNASMIREDEIAFQAVDANLILEKMNTAKKSVNILIVDACRDNPFARSFRSVNRGLAQMDAPTGTIVSFSTAPGKTASDGDGRNSPFTKNLVKAMMRADMPIEAMFKEVRKSVVEETKGQQTPWESSSLIGDFYFKVSK